METTAKHQVHNIYEHLNHLIIQNRPALRSNHTALGQTIRNFRQAKNLTAVHVAKDAGLNPRTFAAIESGRIENPSLSKLQAIVRSLGISLSDLFLQTEAAQPENFYQGDQKGNYALEFQQDGFKVVSYVPINPDFFIGKVTLNGKAFLGAGRLPMAGRIFIQMIFGKLRLTVNQQELHLKEGGHLLINGKLPHTFQNPLSKECSFLFVSAPSFIAFTSRV